MGARVAQPATGEVVRAERLREALNSGAPPTMVSRQTPAHATDLHWKTRTNAQTRSHFLEQIIRTAPDGIVATDRYGNALCVNQAFETMFGYESGDVLGMPIDSLVIPPDRQSESNWITECLSRGETVTIETQRRRQNGTLVDVSITASPLLEDGNCAGSYAVYRDITERKHAHALSSALYRVAETTGATGNLQQFFAAAHSIVDELMYARNFAIALHDPATDTLSFPYFVDEHEIAPAPQKPGHGLTEYVLRTGETLLATRDIVEHLQSRGDVRVNGTPAIDWIGVPLKAGDRTFGALIVKTYSPTVRYSERDKEILTFVSQQLAGVLEHKKSEESLRRSEARYRSLVQSSAYGIYRASLAGKFLDVNPALITMLGYDSAAEVLRLDPQSDVFINADQQERLMEEFRGRGRMDGIEVQWKRKNGCLITVRISGRAVSSTDEPAEVLEAIAEDITERRALEDQFRQAQKMEAVGRLAGGVAHDFNNLLMVINGYTEVILEGMDEENPVTTKIRAIQQASDRATVLARQLLAFSRKQLLELKIVDINEIVENMQRLLRPLIGEHIELLTRLSPDAGRARADAGQLEQVLMNLVVNSKDAMENGGKIVISTAFAPLDEFQLGEQKFIRPGNYVMFSVSDNGQGMDRETQARIFEPFFTTKEKGKGTGLGLSTVYGIVKQSGGYVTVESDVGKGTTFSVYLPLVQGESQNRGTALVPRTPALGTETVLLVEDEESVRQLVKETLEAKGYRVLEAENGEAGLAAAAQHSGDIDLVITDVIMPEIGGRELAQRLQATRPQIKVLYLSGYTEDAIVSEGTIERGKAFLQKPFTLQSLSRKVREVLG